MCGWRGGGVAGWRRGIEDSDGLGCGVYRLANRWVPSEREIYRCFYYGVSFFVARWCGNHHYPLGPVKADQ